MRTCKRADGVKRQEGSRGGGVGRHRVAPWGDLPDDPGVGPAADGAVQAHALLLPHSVGARLDHKLWRMHQAILVHALEVFPVFMDLQRGGGWGGGGDTEALGRAGTRHKPGEPKKNPPRSLMQKKHECIRAQAELQ